MISLYIEGERPISTLCDSFLLRYQMGFRGPLVRGGLDPKTNPWRYSELRERAVSAGSTVTESPRKLSQYLQLYSPSRLVDTGMGAQVVPIAAVG